MTSSMLYLLLASAATSLAASVADKCDWAGPRVDCGYVGIDQDVCEGKGCCWIPVDFKGGPSADLPWCFHSNTGPSEYKLSRVRITAARPGGGGGGLQGALSLSKSTQKELGPDIEEALLEVEEVSSSILRLRITDARRRRWEVPGHLFKSDLLQGSAKALKEASGSGSLYDLAYEKDPFSFRVLLGGKHSRTVFNTTGTRLVFKDQYLELTTWVDPAAFLYGAGERSSETLHLRRNGLPLTLWSHDLGPTFLEQNMYGSHPFVLAMEPGGTSWGALLLNSNGMDIVATEDRLSWRVIGGVIDLFIFLGPSPLAVMDQFTSVVGRPALMPYWSLGWHQCKYGYKSVWEVEEVVANYSAASIPLETIWTDIDHMDRWMDFTFDPKNYPLEEMQRFVGELHKKGQRWVPIVDPGIKVEAGYIPYEQGLREDIFIRGPDGRPYLGWVWPGACHFPDFMDPKAQDFFSRLLSEHHGLVPWDGIWIDMDEISNFCTGDICELRSAESGAHSHRRLLSSGSRSTTPSQAISAAELRDDPPSVCQLDCKEPQGLNSTQRKLLKPPYEISNYLSRAPLGTKGMSLLAYHRNGDLQYNTHNLYSLSEIKVTAEAVKSIRGKRPFVLTRGSFTGAGAYAAHWTGDNAATWSDLQWSIPGVLNIGLFGMPMGGVDICGFQGYTNEELCSRWIALGAFYPFSRDHSDLHGGYQELYRWPVVAETARKVLGMRYRLLPYLYTAFHTAHKCGAPVVRPLWMNFPKDDQTYGNSRQLMVGGCLIVTPVLEEGASQVQGYFPRGLWHDLWEKGAVVDARLTARTFVLDAPLGEIPLHMLGGSIVAMQEPGMTTAAVKVSPLTLAVALPGLVRDDAEEGAGGGQQGRQQQLSATGHLYNDDGESPEAGTSPCNFLHFTANVSYNPVGNTHEAQVEMQFGLPGQGQTCATSTAGGNAEDWEWPVLAGVEVYGWQRDVGDAVVELLRPSSGCGGIEVMSSLTLGDSQVVADGRGLSLDLKGLAHRLKCPHGIRIRWSSGGGSSSSSSKGAAGAVLSA